MIEETDNLIEKVIEGFDLDICKNSFHYSDVGKPLIKRYLSKNALKSKTMMVKDMKVEDIPGELVRIRKYETRGFKVMNTDVLEDMIEKCSKHIKSKLTIYEVKVADSFEHPFKSRMNLDYISIKKKTRVRKPHIKQTSQNLRQKLVAIPKSYTDEFHKKHPACEIVHPEKHYHCGDAMFTIENFEDDSEDSDVPRKKAIDSSNDSSEMPSGKKVIDDSSDSSDSSDSDDSSEMPRKKKPVDSYSSESDEPNHDSEPLDDISYNEEIQIRNKKKEVQYLIQQFNKARYERDSKSGKLSYYYI